MAKRASLSLLHPLLLDQTPKGGDVATFLPTDPRQSERTLHILRSPAPWWELLPHQGELGEEGRVGALLPWGSVLQRLTVENSSCQDTREEGCHLTLPSMSLGSSLCKELQKLPFQYNP